MLYSYFFKIAKVRNFCKESIPRDRNGLEKLRQHLVALELQLQELPPAVFKMLPRLLDEGLALRTLNCNLHSFTVLSFDTSLPIDLLKRQRAFHDCLHYIQFLDEAEFAFAGTLFRCHLDPSGKIGICLQVERL